VTAAVALPADDAIVANSCYPVFPATTSVAEAGQLSNVRSIYLKRVAASGICAKITHHCPPLGTVGCCFAGVDRGNDNMRDLVRYRLPNKTVAVFLQHCPVIADDCRTRRKKPYHAGRSAAQVETDIHRLQCHTEMFTGLRQQCLGAFSCLFHKKSVFLMAAAQAVGLSSDLTEVGARR
jgi:hypothetical protein